MNRSELRRTVTSFRNSMLGKRESDMMCFAVCAPLEGYLRFLGMNTKLVCGEVCKVEHYWIELESGDIVDPTADQFNGRLKKMPKVYIGPKPVHYKRQSLL